MAILPNMKHKEDYYKLRSEIIKAMAHPSRLFIIEEISKGEKCVCELTDMIGADISTISKHLSVLKKAGIVTDRKEGTTVFYRLRVECIMDFMNCIDNVMKSNAKTSINAARCCK